MWLSPGSTVELIEVSTRRVLTEQTTEQSLETTRKTETSDTDQDEIARAVKDDNKKDLKLGASLTVHQSWGTGNATATGSLNMDTTQSKAREESHKHMREQTSKLSTEIKENFKSTFKLVTETTDTSSKRYVLANDTKELLNYELRRKMRQVGVQVQDIGTYLCWEAFVDEPGRELGLANLVNISKPADLVLVPNPKLMPMPPLKLPLSFTGEAVWNFPNNARQRNTDHLETKQQFVPLATLDIPGIARRLRARLRSGQPLHRHREAGGRRRGRLTHGARRIGALRGMITPDGKRVMVGVVTGPGGLAWDDRITFKVSGALICRLLQSKQDDINAANNALVSAKLAADAENQRGVRAVLSQFGA